MATTFDQAELLDRVDHDLEFLGETVEMLVADGPALVQEIRAAIAGGDAAGVGRHAHALKGMISNFCAAEAQACALEVERIGKSGELSAAGVALDALEVQLSSLTTELLAFMKAGS